MPHKNTMYCKDLQQCIDAIVTRVGQNIVLALPLGLGKANHIANGLYQRAANNPALSLHIVTALTLDVPSPNNQLSKNFLQPIIDKFYGDYPQLDYALARLQNKLPNNIKVSEFFFTPGSLLYNTDAQHNYLSSNYTHAARDLMALDINVIAQMVAPHSDTCERLSLSCNPDVTFDLLAHAKKYNKPIFLVAEINQQLPYLLGQAEIQAQEFDCIFTNQNTKNNQLFSIPQKPVGLLDYAIAIHASSMVQDGGTLQIGIGSKGDAIASILALRHKHNQVYQQLVDDLIDTPRFKLRPKIKMHNSIFQQGLYANSEMLVEGLLFLRQHQVLKRKVYPLLGLETLLIQQDLKPLVSHELMCQLLDRRIISLPLNQTDFNHLKTINCLPAWAQWCDGIIQGNQVKILPEDQTSEILVQLARENFGQALTGGHYCHAGFYVGSRNFYQQLHNLDPESRHGLNMCSVKYINQLYGDEDLKREQRRDACFINNAMMITLTGGVISDGIKDYQVVSGVGGQYNFVAQANELKDGRSIICLQSTRSTHGDIASNIIWDYPHITIPRHLRDIIVTEYGAADIQGLSDRDVIARILNVTDSRFQAKLLQQAKTAGKLEKEYQIPNEYRHNLPQNVIKLLKKPKYLDFLTYYPLGSDFTAEEMLVALALQVIQRMDKNYTELFALVRKGWVNRKLGSTLYRNELQRMQLDQKLSLQPNTFKATSLKLLLIGALVEVTAEQRKFLST